MNRKNKLFTVIIVLLITLTGCTMQHKNEYADGESMQPKIAKIECYNAKVEKEFVINDEDTIDNILTLTNTITEIDNDNEKISDFTDDYYMDFYKASVTVIPSDDVQIYTLVFSDSTNIVRMDISTDTIYIPSFLLQNESAKEFEDSLVVYYEISDKDREYLKSFFE